MATSFALPAGLSMRPQREGDAIFMARLFKSSQEHLQLLDAESDLVEELMEMQFRAQREGYGNQFPNAMYFVVEFQGEAVGRAAVDFGANEVRLVDLVFLPVARGRGFGAGVIRSLQMAAAQVSAPLTLTALRTNVRALQLYSQLGFLVEAYNPTHALLAWRPAALAGANSAA